MNMSSAMRRHSSSSAGAAAAALARSIPSSDLQGELEGAFGHVVGVGVVVDHHLEFVRPHHGVIAKLALTGDHCPRLARKRQICTSISAPSARRKAVSPVTLT